MSEGDRPEHADTIAAMDRPELAATQADDAGPRTSSPELTDLPRGAQIGRYLVLHQLGAGGMGAVYAAYDPELDRKVALKVLRSSVHGSQNSGGRARMLREAQAIARLSHPNVVAVHDVGPFGNQVFIAMELVDGATLTAWLAERKRTTDEILATFLQAGRGLAAAHHAGLVHRDFKPDNVLVGKDGRARVVDFGLVRESTAPDTEEPVERDALAQSSSSLLAQDLTIVGTLMGTPRYMAPEQLERKTADARSDQYSFCVALHEALYGQLPERDMLTSKVQPAASPDAARTIPARVRAALRRGLRVEPAARWPTIDDLLAELAVDPGARRRRWLVPVAAGVALAAALLLTSRGKHADDPCGGASERLGSAWDPSRRAAVENAFAATKLPYASQSFASVAKRLDGYAETWRHSYEDSCRATHVRHEQSTEMLDLRSACLAHHRSELAAFVDLLAHADPALVRGSVAATEDLPSAAECDDLESLQAPVPRPSDPAARRAIEELHDELTRAEALTRAGKFKNAQPQLEAIRERARKLGYPPLEAESSFVLEVLYGRTGNTEGAAHACIDAYTRAIAGHHDELAFKAANGCVFAAAESSQLAHAEEWTAIAQAALERTGSRPELEALLLRGRGYLLSAAGKHEEAVAAHESARAIRERLMPGTYELASTYTSLSYDYDELGKYAESRAMGERALAIEERLLGPDHPEVAVVLNNLGNIAVDQGDLDAARAYYERVLAIRERAVLAGSDPRKLANIVHNLGELAAVQGKYDEATERFERAIELYGRIDKEDPEVTLPMVSLGNVMRHRGACRDALEQFQRALAIVEHRLRREHPYASDALVGIGACTRELGRLDESQTALDRALAIRKTDARPTELAEAEFELAQTLWARGTLDRAKELANTARTLYAADKASARPLGDVDAWLRAH